MTIKKILAAFIGLTFLLFGVIVFADQPKTASQLGFNEGFPPTRLVDMSKWDKG